MKKQTKQILIKFGIGIIGLFILFLYNRKTYSVENKIESDYYKSVNLKFSGTVKKVKPLTKYGHDYGVVAIDIYNSNTEYYDPRDSLNRFLGIVKNKKVELVFNRMSGIKTGDSIDFEIDEFKIYRNGRMVQENVVGMPPNDVFKPFNEIKKNIEL